MIYCVVSALYFHQQRGFAAGAVFMECCLIGLWNLGCFFKAIQHLHDQGVAMGESAGWDAGRKSGIKTGRREAEFEARKAQLETWREQDRQRETQRQARREADEQWRQTHREIQSLLGDLPPIVKQPASEETAGAEKDNTNPN